MSQKFKNTVKRLRQQLKGERFNRDHWYQRYQETQRAIYGEGGAFEEIAALQRLLVDHQIALPPSKLVDLKASYPEAKEFKP